ncbi:MAG TPA: glycoside hydrolase family 2 TIM barrel-domain containing protein [Streptosporangiaceae bacterium]
MRDFDRTAGHPRREPGDSGPARGIRPAGPWSRRVFLRTAAGGTAGMAAWSLLSARGPAASAAKRDTAGMTRSGSALAAGASGPAAKVTSFDTGWLFGPSADGSDQPGFDDSDLATVTLPHTVAPLSWQNWDPSAWEKVWVYRKHFDAPAGLGGLRVFLDFSAALTHATATLNGTQVADHLGGYLPFSAEITSHLQPENNVLAVTLDSTFNIDVPPDRPAPAISTSVDFWQPGGIYRNVSLRAVPQIFLADVFAKPVNVLDASTRQVDVQATVDAAVVPADSVTLRLELADGSHTLATATTPVTISQAGQVAVNATLSSLPAITLWDTAHPKLYTVIATLVVNGSPLHNYQVRIGFREASFRLDGFYLNGDRVQLFGLNRHQIFPWAGHALPARVQARDAEILRHELNCNIVRCSHYPQSEAFYDACDELGLLVWEEIPGWGYLGDTSWQQAAYQDVHDMIVRSRNRPSVIVWGAMPNEAGEYVAEYTLYNNLAHALDDSRPTGGDAISRTDAGFVFDVFSYHDYSSVTGSDGVREPTLAAPTDAAGQPYLVCEAVGTLSGPALYYRRTDTQAVQQGEATAHAIVHNIAASDDRYCGVVAWACFDYPSGNGNQFQGTKYVGVHDLFRIPKPGAAIYQAQVDPETRPVIAPAFYWDFGPTSPVTSLGSAMICSNLDQLQVYVGGNLFATVTPDTSGYGHLPYPPSFVDFSTVDGSARPDLRIDGYLGGTRVASRSLAGDPSGDRLSLAADDDVIDGDGADATRLVFRAVDRFGAPRPYVTGPVTLTVDGPGVLVGDNPIDFTATGGAAAVWIRSLPGSPGVVTVRASHATLGQAAAQIKVQAVPSSGAPVPYGSLAVTASPALVTPGGTTTVTATLDNNGLLGLDQVTFSVTLPGGWTASPAAPVTMTRVRAGHTARASWKVTVPAGANPGQDPVTVQAVYTAGKQRGVTYSSANVLRAYTTLGAAYNNTGISDDSDVTTANFDGVGNSYSAQALAAASLAPGATVTHDGITFTWPVVPPGQPDNVVAQGQTVLVSGSGTTLGLLGAGSPANASGSGTVHYTDGSTSNFTVTLDNYFNKPGTGNDIIATLPYLNDSDPATAGGTAGQRDQTVYVFYAPAAITAGKTVQAVTLPSSGIVPAGGGRINGMHVFALGIGPLSAKGVPVSGDDG